MGPDDVLPPGHENAIQVPLRSAWERPFCVGRSPRNGRCDIVLDNLRVSWRHAIFVTSNSPPGFIVVDLQSGNGTCLWGRGSWHRVGPNGARGQWGDLVRLGGRRGVMLRIQPPSDPLVRSGA